MRKCENIADFSIKCLEERRGTENACTKLVPRLAPFRFEGFHSGRKEEEKEEE